MQQNSVYFFSLFRNSFPPKQRHMIYVINLIFHGDFDAIVFISIWLHQDGLERREGHPGGVQQEKCMFLLWTCDTCYYPIFLWRIRWKYFHFDLASPGWPRTPRRTSWWSTARQNINFELSACYRLLFTYCAPPECCFILLYSIKMSFSAFKAILVMKNQDRNISIVFTIKKYSYNMYHTIIM